IDSGQFNKSEPTDFVSGCAILIKRAVIEKIGMFDPKYYLYLEDVDLCERAKRAGFKLWYEPKAVLWHKNASSSGKPGSELHVYYQTRNRLLFGFRYAGFRTKIALLKEAVKMLLKDKTRKQAVLDFFLGRLGKVW
ncbi:glycosyltransferase family 2 protein, partial [Candidatus Roizmanbacteria bacterium]|nr:glycosyltransferase family 2 protein [Candidatus Roizmanbacteria bacterium]